MKKAAEILALALAVTTPAWCWDDHDQLSWLSLRGEEWAGDMVVAEELLSFLEAEKAAIAGVLEDLEARLAESLPSAPPRPAALAFDPALSGQALLHSFSRALRVNPERPFVLFLQPLAGEEATHTGDPLPLELVDLFSYRFPSPPFRALPAGSEVAAARVVASASDEPDYGMDLGLYEDNGTAWGSVYGFGTQPWGNPALVYGSQAPFHMSFPWEDPVIKLAAAFVGRGLAAYRVEQYTALARHAMESGHEYWGYRFAGWALHYLQDMAQPYHARLMPGKGTLGMLSLYALGSTEDIDGAVVLLSNRHLVIEDWAYRIVSSWSGDAGASPLFAALSGGGEAPPYREGWAYDVVARAAYERGPALDALIVKAFPAGMVSDPSYDFGADPGRPDALAALRDGAPGMAAELEAAVAAIFSDLGAGSRAYLSFIRDHGARPAPREAPVDLRGPLYLAALAGILAGIAALALWAVRRRRRRRAARAA